MVIIEGQPPTMFGLSALLEVLKRYEVCLAYQEDKYFKYETRLLIQAN